MKSSYLSCTDLSVSPESNWFGVIFPIKRDYDKELLISINLGKKSLSSDLISRCTQIPWSVLGFASLLTSRDHEGRNTWVVIVKVLLRIWLIGSVVHQDTILVGLY